MVDLLIKKISLTCFLILLFPFCVSALDSSELSAKSAVLLNRQTKEIVYEKNAFEKRSMASTTKIMTALLACESGKLDETVEITSQMCAVEGTSVGLKAGYKLRLYDLVCAMMLESGNDAANATAIYLASSLESFAKLMNEKAKQIGMSSTNFVTASGLDDENHYTTAYDMALLGDYAMDNPVLKEICSSKSCKVDYISPDITLTYSNHNRLLSSYNGAYGIKTGFTKKSGRCLVSAAKGENGDFICVTLSAFDDWLDHKKMLDYAFQKSTTYDYYIRIPESIAVIGGTVSTVKIETNSPYRISVSSDEEITQKIYLGSFVYAPFEKGDVFGKAQLYRNGKCILTLPITAAESCESIEPTYKEKNSFFKRLKSGFFAFFGFNKF